MPPRESDTPRRRDESGDIDYPSYQERDLIQDAQTEIQDAQTEEIAATEEIEESEQLALAESAGQRYDASGKPLGARATWPDGEASALVKRYLFVTEKFRGEWRKHWTYLFGQFSYGVIATVLLGWSWGYLVKHDHTTLATIVIVAWIIVMSWVGLRVGDWYYDRFILTNKRIMEVSGMFTRTVSMMPLLRVTDMKYEQTPMGRIFNYGNFVLESAGQDQTLREVRHLPNPNELYLRIVEEMYEPEAVEAKLSERSALDDDGS